jgi:predicted transcriptional regulator
MQSNLYRFNRRVALLIIISILISFFFIISNSNAIAQDTSQPDPIAGLDTISEKEFIYTSSGQEEEYELVLRNNGAQKETFLISIESDNDWAVSLSQSVISLDAAKSEFISVIFEEIPSNINEKENQKDYQFNVIVKSRNVLADSKTIHVISTQDQVIITAALRPVLVIEPSLYHIGKINPGNKVTVDVGVKCYVVSATVYLNCDILDAISDKLYEEKSINIKIIPEIRKIQKGEHHTFEVTIEFQKSYERKINDNLKLEIQAKTLEYKDPITKPKIITFRIFNDPRDTNYLDVIVGSPVAIVGITSVVILGIVAVAIGGTEVGKYKFLLLLFIPLYTKLHKDKILDHFTRGRVYEYIRNHPGTHYSEIKRELDLNNGSLTYHLHTLEREALIKSQNISRYKLFYPTGVKIPKNMEQQISAIRNRIRDIIQENPGITQKEISLMLNDKSQRTISYHVKSMTRAGIIRVEKVGRENKCFINDEVMDAGEVKFIETKDKDDVNSSNQNYIEKDGIFRQI